MRCVPMCVPGTCAGDDGCGGKCRVKKGECGSGKQCCVREGLCLTCCPPPMPETKDCACPAPLNPGWSATQTCDDTGEWGACVPEPPPAPVADLHFMDLQHDCGYSCRDSKGVPDPAGPNWCAGPSAAPCYVQKGPQRALPHRNYRMDIYGFAASALLLTIEVYDATNGKLLKDPPPIVDVRDVAPFSASVSFTVPPISDCDLLEFRIYKRNVDSLQIYNTTITAL